MVPYHTGTILKMIHVRSDGVPLVDFLLSTWEFFFSVGVLRYKYVGTKYGRSTIPSYQQQNFWAIQVFFTDSRDTRRKVEESLRNFFLLCEH